MLSALFANARSFNPADSVAAIPASLALCNLSFSFTSSLIRLFCAFSAAATLFIEASFAASSAFMLFKLFVCNCFS
jgi:hypothetical protein